MYVQYVSRTFKSAVIVFDGYDNPDSTKKSEQQRRYANISPQFSITEVTPLSVGQEKFLANSENKKQLVEMLKKNSKNKSLKYDSHLTTQIH